MINFKKEDVLNVFNDECIAYLDILKLRHQKSSRIIIQDENNKIGLLYSHKYKYWEIPGGRVENGETFEEAAVRESKEEVGCDIKILSRFGKTYEVRHKDGNLQESEGFYARLGGEKGLPEYMEDELDDEFEVFWLPIQVAIKNINEMDMKDSLYREYIKQRALIFLREAKKYI